MLHAMFMVLSVTKHHDGGESVELSPVVGKGNEEWSKYTPSGALRMYISAEGAQGKLEPGKKYRLTFEPADA